MEKWAGKIAVVTGASVGIGAAIVKNFAKNGIVVIGLARRSEKIEEIARNLDGGCGKIYVKKCDVSDLKSIKEAFKWIEEEFGVVHIIVNNAAILFNGKILGEGEETAENLNNVINTNLTGVVHCTREAVRLIKNSNEHGMIININSVLGHNIPFSGARLNVYPPTKYALTAMSEVLRQELIVDNNEKIRVTNLSPGSVKTDIVVSGGFADNNDDYFKQMPCLSAEDVAETVSFLLETPHNVNISQLTIMPVGER
ncbi:CLUMA_CG003413, isoform A [Clunio marinus]|uniref:CLUMA_CG003413, isoform A n=1 Tax=Clunio marinus TaxID=568069 RepID=A0A1J1HNS8_9DIPT|nr:CLUMA_CG003413, isoform A [Clunio marinus]